VRTGRLDEGVRMMELSRMGVSGESKPLFQSPDQYSRTASLPYLKITFLEGLASAYEAAKRPDDALKNWHDMYETAAASGFAVAKAESAHRLADLYKARKELTKSINFYALAAEASAAAGNEQSRTDALASEESLLFQQGDKDKAFKIEEELLSSSKTSKNLASQFIHDLVIAELLDGTEVIKSVSGINAGFPAIVLDYSEDKGTESITVKNVMAYRVMTANFGANAVIAYRSPAASGSFLPRITGNELTFAWENVIPSRRVTAAIEQIGNIITLEQMSELLIRCVVSP
jgi:tetratricopeptide (TPR) repeat protein